MFFGELALLQWLESIRTPALNTLMEAVTALGEDTILIVLIAVWYFMVQKEGAYRLCFLTICSLGINGILKNLFHIPRPFHTGKVTCVRPETATGYSFPSGHTQNISTWTTALARLLRKRWLLITAIIVSVAIGCSRMYLGAHYPSDVIVGLILGISIGILGSALYEKLKNPVMMFAPVFLGMLAFGIFFLIKPDPHYADYFKCLGLMGGLTASSHIDRALIRMNYNVSFTKKLFRVVGAIVFALIFKAGLEAIPVPENLSLFLIWDAFHYLVLITLIFGLYPLILQKIKW
ncbi:MAG: phosphatase PAP2 family protein [Ruminococcaceae bacterium]|nr:phosphatase PAP2 family protein [Oscillospiraceae bacterium]